jgi:uncharacterized protein (DUF4415 family)
MHVKSKSGRSFRVPDSEEETRIRVGIAADPDPHEVSAAQLKRLHPHGRGRPPSSKPLKVSTTIRFDADVLEALKATGPGWQTRVNEVVRAYVATLR